MPWTYSFTDVGWANGDYLTETKMDQMVANDKYLRDEIGFRWIHCMAQAGHDGSSTSYVYPAMYVEGYPWRFRIEIGGTRVCQGPEFTYSAGANIITGLSDQDISGISEGIHTIKIGFGAAGLTTVTQWYHYGRIVKTNDMERLSVRASYSAIATGYKRAALNWAHVLFHREDMSWF